MKPLQDYPTPEADACHRRCVLNAGPANGIVMWAKAQDLERRLAACQDALWSVRDLSHDSELSELANATLNLTKAP